MIIAIAGGTGSGKTTLSKKIQELYKQHCNINVSIVSMDNYYKNKHTHLFENYDHPNAFDIDLLYDDLSAFLSTGQVIKRSYDYVSKESYILEIEKDIQYVILEGLYPFYMKKIRDICSIKIYLDVDEKLRIQRRLLRDLEERNISIKENMKMINGFVKEMHKEYVVEQKELADQVFIGSENITFEEGLFPLIHLKFNSKFINPTIKVT